MSQRKPETPAHIKLSQEQREQITLSIQSYFLDEFEEEISHFKSRSLLEFFLVELGAPVYNQAVQHASQFMQNKLSDMEATLFEPEHPYSSR